MSRTSRGWLVAAATLAVLAVSCQCGTKPCSPSTCSGCCDSSGTCQLGNNNQACGVSGASCTQCAVTQACVAGACLGGGGGTGTGGGSGGGTGGGSGGGTGGGSGGGTGGGSPGDFAAWCASWSSAYCDTLISCGSVDSSGKTDCVSFLATLFCELPSKSTAKGYSHFDATAGETCLQKTIAASATCDTSAAVDCTAATLSPATASGQPCYQHFDCIGTNQACVGSGCNRTCQAATGTLGSPCRSNCSDDSWCDPGTSICTSPKAAGASCTTTYDNECDTASYCDLTVHKCKPLPGTGQLCAEDTRKCATGTYCDYSGPTYLCTAVTPVGQSCTSDTPCGDSAFCDWSQGQTCQTRRAQGASCTSSSQCQPQLICRGSQCQPRLSAGQTCSSWSDCQSGLDCDSVYRKCLAYTSAKVGQPCTGFSVYCSGSSTSCRGTQVNPDGGVGTPGTCVIKSLGDLCTRHSDCPSQAYCQPPNDAGTCTAAAPGTPCSGTSNCVATQYCSSSTCIDRKGAGQPCTGYEQCLLPNQCQNPGDGGTRLCGQPVGIGSNCAQFGSCKFPGVCTAGTCVSGGRIGQGCFANLCTEGYCASDGGSSLCVAAKATGATCGQAIECTSHLCTGGQCQAACP